MLRELRGAGSPGVVIVTDSASISGRRLLHSLIVAAIERKERVHLFSLEFPAEDFLSGIPSRLSSRLVVHDGFSDPLCWLDGCPPLPSGDITARRIRELVGGWSGPVTVVMDSLSWIVGHCPLPRVCRALRDLCPTHTPAGSPQMCLLTVLHSDLHPPAVLQSLAALAHSLIQVAAAAGDAQRVSIIQRKKSGKVVTSVEHVRILEDHSLQITAESQSEEASRAEVDPAENLTFNLRLSEAEREQREAAALPYAFSQSKKSSLLQGAAGSAKIFYDPEPSDDLDHEDPDDDLDV